MSAVNSNNAGQWRLSTGLPATIILTADLVAVSDRSNRRAATAMITPPPIIRAQLVMDRVWTFTPCRKSRCRVHQTPMNPLPSSMGLRGP